MCSNTFKSVMRKRKATIDCACCGGDEVSFSGLLPWEVRTPEMEDVLEKLIDNIEFIPLRELEEFVNKYAIR